MNSVPAIKKVMTPFPYSVDSHEDVLVAKAMMQQHGIRHLPVMHEGKLAGVLSERELQVAQAILGIEPRPAQLPVWAVCTREPFVVDLNEPIDRVVEEMADRHIGSVIVVRDEKLVGILTTTDVCRLYVETFVRDPSPDVA
jgi:acetoin utilization protein AcuB